MNAKTLVNALLNEKTTMSFGQANVLLFPGHKFVPTTNEALIAEFEGVEAGASALLVDQHGFFSSVAPATHEAWLRSKGYTVIPGRKAPKAKKGFGFAPVAAESEAVKAARVALAAAKQKLADRDILAQIAAEQAEVEAKLAAQAK